MSDSAGQGSGSSRMDRARALALVVIFCVAAALPALGAVLPPVPPMPPVPPAPAVLAWTAPSYPPVAQEARLTPTVQVRVRIDPEGNVIDAVAERQLPLGISEASVAAAREWRFAPGSERSVVLSFELRLDRSGSRLKRPAEVLDPLHLRIWGLLPAKPAPPLQPCSLEGVDFALTRPEPKVLSWSAPSYSAAALKARLEGTVMVAAEVDASGAVIWTCARKGLPMKLGENSERAIEDWRFAPDPRPVRWVEVELSFAIADGEDGETERPAELLTPLHLRVWGTPPAVLRLPLSSGRSQPGRTSSKGGRRRATFPLAPSGPAIVFSGASPQRPAAAAPSSQVALQG